MEACNSSNATYLFQQDKHYDLTYDTGDKAIQCGRHNDVFKLWLAWRAKGDSGYEKQVDYAMDLSRWYVVSYLYYLYNDNDDDDDELPSIEC